MIIKALSLWNPPFLPWATLCVTGDKQNETRPRRMLYRGPLLIHATASCPLRYEELPELSSQAKGAIVSAKRRVSKIWGTHDAYGVILGVVDVIGCEEVSLVYEPPDEPERSFGNYAYGRFVIALANPRLLKVPIPASGRQGLWNFETTGQAELERLLQEP